MIKLKRCSKCKQVKATNDFHKDCSKIDGLHSSCKDCYKIYYQNHHKERRAYSKEYEKRRHKERHIYNQKYYRDRIEKERVRKRQYGRDHREERRIYRMKLRLKLLQKVSGEGILQCVNCGCEDIRFLEINHINGGGSKEKKLVGGQGYFHRNILNGTRKTDDLNVMCKVCNALDVLKRKYGEVPMEVVWNSKEVVLCQG